MKADAKKIGLIAGVAVLSMAVVYRVEPLRNAVVG